jgi:nitrogen fixation NifU-like protein
MEREKFHSQAELEREVAEHKLAESFFHHARLPRNVGRLEKPSGGARGVGTCGDIIEVFIEVTDGTICKIRQAPAGCVYTTACGSAMSSLVESRTLEQALRLTPDDVSNELGGLPEDHLHCASLAVNTLGEAIDDYYQKTWGKTTAKNKREPEDC